MEGEPSRRSRRGAVILSNFLSAWQKAGLSVAYLSSKGFNCSSKALLALDEVAIVREEEGPC